MLTKSPVSVNKFFALLWVKKEKKRAHIAFSSDFGYDVSDLEKQREGNAMNRRKILCIILIIAVLAGTAAAFFLSGSSSAPETAPEGEDLAAQLAGLDGVVSVESVEQNAEDADGNPQYCYRYKYFVTFRQPLDWKDPSAGTFDQRVLIGIDDKSAVNVLETQGYIIPESNIHNDPRLDQEILLHGNYVEIEHRFFGESVPEGLSRDGTALWNYMTTYNAASDQYKVVTELKKLLPGKWVATGRSKGGLTANMLSMYYPDAVDLTVSYVAPLADDSDTRFYHFIYEEAANVHYGEAERELMTEFQIECLKRRSELMPSFEEAAEASGAAFREQTTPDVLFDVCVLETAAGTWQYNQDFARIEACLGMPEETDDEKAAKTAAFIEIITEAIVDTDVNSPYFPYFIEAAQELGNYVYDFSYLRQALRERGMEPSEYLTLEEGRSWCAADLAFTDEQREVFVYDGTMNRALKEWVETTDSHVIMIYGSSDPWYATRIPDTDNPNVRIFVSDRTPHTTVITDERAKKNNDYSFEKDEQAEIVKAITDWLQ